jgi:hypothetical protein
MNGVNRRGRYSAQSDGSRHEEKSFMYSDAQTNGQAKEHRHSRRIDFAFWLSKRLHLIVFSFQRYNDRPRFSRSSLVAFCCAKLARNHARPI